MSRKQVKVQYSGSTDLDIDEDCIVDDLLGTSVDPTDEQIVDAIERDIASYMENGPSVRPVEHAYHYERDALIASVRAALAKRKAEDTEP